MSSARHRREVKSMDRNNSPPDVRIERERTNRLVAQQGWGPTLRLKVLRTPVAAGALILGAVFGALAPPTVLQMLFNIF